VAQCGEGFKNQFFMKCGVPISDHQDTQ
jgi:hypothetical protein